MIINNAYLEKELPSYLAGWMQAGVKQLSWEQLPADIMLKFQRNGMRNAYRPVIEAQQLYNGRVPGSIKALGEPAVRQFLKGKDASHIKSYANGGDGKASNIVFEDYKQNRARGARNMNRFELSKVRASNHFEFLRSPAFYKQVGINTAKGAVAGAIFSASTSAFTNIWNAIDGDVSWEEAGWNIVDDTKSGALVGGISALGLTFATFACPPVGGLLAVTSPYLMACGIGVTGFNILNFAIEKFFKNSPDITLLLTPKWREHLIIPKSAKLYFPSYKVEIYNPKIELIKTEIYRFPEHPLVYSLESK